ncbi:hypothetical protein DIURU_005377 [Diutina rugosa]|uniref:Protein MSS2, mitochondrial n=1 Tax=Diutina rugosa TaxID=5481 RepID=A0A642UG21_DIURU|nr:uncharacterized protein DIURU_005377 [Diutina rugosa]KAA8897144.1 hypothetical protein DIURU_005377 [Diutina rugosa]
MSLRLLRWSSTTATTKRPELLQLLPKKKTLNRVLFDNDANLSYRKALPVLTTIYDNLDTPERIQLGNVKAHDLMTLKHTLASVRQMSNTINPHLVKLEHELVEQAAERGDNDAIAMLAFDTITKRAQDKNSVDDDDYKHAQRLVKQLTEIDHCLTYKLAGDLAFSQGYHQQARDYWHRFVELEPSSIRSSHVYTQLGIYYFAYHPELERARRYFERAVAVGEVDDTTVKAHYYLGQLYESSNPELTRYHWEVAASRALAEVFPSLGRLELNMFKNASQALQWFKLGDELGKDIQCVMGQFDCYVALGQPRAAVAVVEKLEGIRSAIKRARRRAATQPAATTPAAMASAMATNDAALTAFFTSRDATIKKAMAQL